MKYRKLGRTDIDVSVVCQGCWSIVTDDATWGSQNPADSIAAVRASLDAGVNFFDTAEGYGGGESEEILARELGPRLKDVVVASKLHLGPPPHAGRIRRACDASLKRLGTDRLDVLFMHQWDGTVPLEETLRALEKLVADGKVLYLGASNYAAWQIATALGISERRGWPRFDVLQPMYNLVKRQVEVEILPLAEQENLAVMPYSPLGGGLLTGKYDGGAEPEGTRLVANPMYVKRYRDTSERDTASAYTAFCRERGLHPVSTAVAWVGAHPQITCPIIGARSVDQLKPSLDAVNVDMTPDLREEIAALSRTPPPATDRSDERG